jgi:hypothetical protein
MVLRTDNQRSRPDEKDVAWEQRRPNRPELACMANCLLDCREMRPEPLRPEVQFGPVLILWLRVNEEPPLVPFERQRPSGLQHRPTGPLASLTAAPSYSIYQFLLV